MKKNILIIISLALISFSFSECSNKTQKVVNKTETNLVSNAINTNNKMTTTQLESNETALKTENCVGVVSGNTSFVFNPTVVENLVKVSNSILKVKIVGKGDTFYPVEKSPYPITKYKVEVIEVLSSSNEKKDLKEILVIGGDISVYEYKKANPEQTKKLELDKYTDTEAKEKYFSFVNDYDYNFKNNNEYVVILNKNNFVILNGYGIFEIDNNTNTLVASNEYKNVLTQKALPKVK